MTNFDDIDYYFGGGQKIARLRSVDVPDRAQGCGYRWNGHTCPSEVVESFDAVPVCAWHYWKLTGIKVDRLAHPD